MKGSILVVNMAAAGTAANNNDREVILKNCDPFTDWISEINNILIVNANGIWQYYRDDPCWIANGGAIDDFPGNSASCKFKQK